VESSCEFGIEPSGFIKCLETIECGVTGVALLFKCDWQTGAPSLAA
jgi:hypothetical protein